MTRQEAESLAGKRNRQLSKFMSDRCWRADHDSVKGWHVRLGWVLESRNGPAA